MSKKQPKSYVVGFYDDDGEVSISNSGTFVSLAEAKEFALEWAENLQDDEIEDNFIFEVVPVFSMEITPPPPVTKKVKWVSVGSR
jgi:hypothetical protein